MPIYLFPQDQPDGKAGLARQGGAELRDYFASHAPAVGFQSANFDQAAKVAADWAFTFADAMMERRKITAEEAAKLRAEAEAVLDRFKLGRS